MKCLRGILPQYYWVKHLDKKNLFIGCKLESIYRGQQKSHRNYKKTKKSESAKNEFPPMQDLLLPLSSESYFDY